MNNTLEINDLVIVTAIGFNNVYGKVSYIGDNNSLDIKCIYPKKGTVIVVNKKYLIKPTHISHPEIFI